MTFFFGARILYYEIFYSGFNIMLFNGMRDERNADYSWGNMKEIPFIEGMPCAD